MSLNSSWTKIISREIAKPTADEWGTAMEAMEASLQLERTVNDSLLTLHKAADDKVYIVN